MDAKKPSSEDFEALQAVKASRIPIERPDLYERIANALGFVDVKWPPVRPEGAPMNPPQPPKHQVA